MRKSDRPIEALDAKGSWESERSIVVRKRVMIVERRAGSGNGDMVRYSDTDNRKGRKVTDFKSDSVEIRILASAENSPKLFDLRCEIREKILLAPRPVSERFPKSSDSAVA
jgi:hypothetical protein